MGIDDLDAKVDQVVDKSKRLPRGAEALTDGTAQAVAKAASPRATDR